ncbi:glycosyltransferase family 4 protein [Hymenobacter canadensis]|uniref:Glycosyltransferase family 4 protein n=1 Tax=Hymenobacter canadensis TaxID=2999067 RepID=A0ABY7LPZ0_9BACT|nr:glycosyltransferase family 4 protein [Hymenobacter canadensis]WBA41966.1 glycosyltransferase family 4 protein [Hymenobacter canadensis]
MAQLLFVLHEASRTGAPFTQLHLMRWIKQHTTHDVMLLLMWGGDLVSEFEKLGEVYVLDEGKPARTLKERALFKFDSMTQYRRKHIMRRIASFSPQVIFANTAITLTLVVELKKQLQIPLLLNVHELDSTFYHYSQEEFRNNLPAVDYFIPGSYAVKHYYEGFCTIPSEKTAVIYDYIEDALSGVTTPEQIRKEHGIPAGAKIVGAIASLMWRKGADLFIQVAREVLRADPEVYFIWVGGKKESYQFKELMRDVQLLGLADRLLFVGGKSDLRGYYEGFDVFLLTSREDPFPLVCLEAGLAGTPVICFEHSGGMPEFVRDDAGFVVPYLDIQQMAARTLQLLHDPTLRQQKGTTAQQRVQQSHTMATIGPALYAAMQKFLPAQ